MSQKYKRVLLKLSGEALAGDQKKGFEEATCVRVATQIKELVEAGVEIAVVIGGGNFWRGCSSKTIERTKADQIGMLATVMNCLYMSEICRSVGVATQVFTPFACSTFSELFSKDRLNECLSQRKVVFLAGGTGHPYFSTDTATVLRAVEIDAEVVLAARNIDGVYDSDPKKNPQAKKFDSIPIQRIVDEKLGIMDLSAAVICMEQHMPMIVFGLSEEQSIVKAVNGNSNGTIIKVD